MSDQNRSACCNTSSMCGAHSLAEGVVIVGWATMVISAVLFLACSIYLFIHKHRESRDPTWFVQTISAMTIVCLAAYQIIISILMLWQNKQRQPNFFFFTLFYVSHLSIVLMYCMIFSALVVVHITNGYHVWGIAYFVICTAHVATLIYFEVVMNSYMNSGVIESRFL